MRTGGIAGEFAGGAALVGRERGSALAIAMGQPTRRAVPMVARPGDSVSEFRLLLQRWEVSDRRLRKVGHGFLDARVDLVLDGFHGHADRVADGKAGG